MVMRLLLKDLILLQLLNQFDCGAKPIIAPIDEYLNMDKDGTEKLITKKNKSYHN